MMFHVALVISVALPGISTSDEVTLLQTAQVVHHSHMSSSHSSTHTRRNLSAHVADPGTPCATEQGWQIATLPESSLAAGSYCLPPASSGAGYGQIQRTLLRGDTYEESTHRALEKHMLHAVAGDFVHGGTFIGDYLPHLEHLAKPGSRVYAFEPDPLYFTATRGTIGESSLTKIFTVQAGMSNETAIFEVATGTGTNNLLCVPIDDVLEADRPVSLIFLDVDGYELLALQGAENWPVDSNPAWLLVPGPGPSPNVIHNLVGY